jgi:ribosomal protein S12 methylthiotransferase accessory factor
MADPLPRLAFPGMRRGRHPSDTWRLIQPFLRQAGITRVAQVAGLDVMPIPVVMVTRPLSASLSVTQGKGLSLEAAKVSGVMEAVEHYHAETCGGEIRLARARDLDGTSVDASRLAGRLPAYDPHRLILWQAGKGAVSGRPVWIPFDAVHLDLRIDGAAASACFIPSSNGLASGNDSNEATVHALCEVIERHLVAEFYERPVEDQEGRRVLNASIIDPDCRALMDLLARAGLEVTVWDLSTELEVPVFFCELLGERDEFRRVLAARGFGCHTDKGVALSRAIAEAAQSRVTTIAGSRDDMTPQSEQESILRDRLTRHQWHLRAGVRPSRLFRAIATHAFQSFADEIEFLSRRLEAAGFGEPVVVDLSKPGWPIAVVRVVVAGARFDPTEGRRGLGVSEGRA